MALGALGFRTAAAAAYTKNGASVVYCSLHPAANYRISLLEVGIFNTSASAVAMGLTRITACGTVSTSEAFQSLDLTGNPTLQTVLDETWSVNPTTSNTPPLWRAFLAGNSGAIWTFAPDQMLLSNTASLALVNMTGTGQILDVYFKVAE